MRHYIHYVGISHTGYVRAVNEDSIVCENHYVFEPFTKGCQQKMGCVSHKRASVFGVFDGMGGLSHGEVASSLAAEQVKTFEFEKNPIAQLKQYCIKANRAICDFARKNNLSSIGTTAAMLVFSKQKISLCNIGDSKIFRVANGSMEQISKDHTTKCFLNNKRLLTQNLGILEDEMQIVPYFAEGVYQDGDIYVICSDGLTDMLSEKEIKETILGTPFEQVHQKLLEKALEAGGKDNISIVMCRIEKRTVFSFGKEKV